MMDVFLATFQYLSALFVFCALCAVVALLFGLPVSVDLPTVQQYGLAYSIVGFIAIFLRRFTGKV